MQQYLVQSLRSVVFHVAVFLFTAVYSSVSVWFVFFLPFHTRYRYLSLYSRTIIFFCKSICGINYRVEGQENLSKHRAYVVISNHQSQWETFFLVNLLQPLTFVCKKELLKLPMGVGQGIGLLRPIAIDRASPKKALADILDQGKVRLLEEHLPVLMFPEGTRTKPGDMKKFARSAAALAIAANVPVIFISHNSGYFWPTDRLMKFPGTVTFRISEPVSPTNKTADELTKEAEDWIREHFQPLLR